MSIVMNSAFDVHLQWDQCCNQNLPLTMFSCIYAGTLTTNVGILIWDNIATYFDDFANVPFGVYMK